MLADKKAATTTYIAIAAGNNTLTLFGPFMDEANSVYTHHIASLYTPTQMRFAKATRLDGHGLTFEQPCDPLLALFRIGASQTAWAGRRVVFGIALRFSVGGDEALIVAQHGFTRCLTDQVLRPNGYLATTAGSIHDISGDGIAGSVPAQRFHDLDALADRRAEVT